jgi:3'-5' exoribonuclease
VKGKYSVDETYGPQIVVKTIGDPVEGFDESDFTEKCPNSMKEVGDCFEDLLDAIDPAYADFLRLVLDEEGDKSGDFWTAPASAKLHQAYAGGLAEHSVQVADIAFITTRWCPGLDDTVLVTAGLLHDISKPLEYEGIGREQSDLSKLVGNTTLSYQTACALLSAGIERCPGLESGERVDNIRHCIIAHHGRREWGSPVVPRTMEAWLIHLADMISSRIGYAGRLPGGSCGQPAT